jgi:hypothetical protein
MPSHPPSQLALFDAPAPARPERTGREARPERAEGAAQPEPTARRERSEAVALPEPATSHERPAQPAQPEPTARAARSEAAAPSEHSEPADLFADAPDEGATRGRLPVREDAVPLAADLARRLSAALGMSVHLRLTDNRATLVSFRRGPEGLRLRAHHLFLGAPDAVVHAMARYIGRNDAGAGEALEAYARSRRGLVRRERRPGKPLRTRGKCFDLRALFARLNTTHFDGRVNVDVGWARKPGRARRRSIHLGGYDARLREIRIHPALDRPHVPAFVVDYLVFHAMLHADLAGPGEPALDADGRCAPEHTPEFSEREAAFPLREAAQRWLVDNLSSLKRG